MRILIVSPVPPDPDGAGAIPILLHAQLSGLRERNEVTLVSAVGDEPGEAEAAARAAEAGVDAHFADRRQPAAAVARWRRRGRLGRAWLGGTPWRAAWFAAPRIQGVLDRLGAEREFDVVVVEDSAMSGFRLPAGVATVLTEHEVLRPRKADRPPARPGRWPGWAFAELDWRKRPPFQRAAWRHFDRVLAYGSRDAAAIAELAPEVADRVRVCPFGIELPPPATASGEQPGQVLFSGNFTHWPNREAALWLVREIMPAVRAHRPEAQLQIVGASPPAEIVALAGPGVEVHADVPSVDPHIEAAAVVVAPVRSGGGMRMKVLQALAAGRAVVTTGRGAEGFDCFGEPPPLAIAGEAGAFAAEVAALLADPGRREELGRRARAFAEAHHGPAAWAARLQSAYEGAIQG
jgi:glycosyltransferase involved in cell wall biosynthesis